MKQKKYKKILIIRTGAIGDVVHTTALLHAIKKISPETQIHYLTSPLIKPLLESDPDIDKILTINPKFKLFSAYTKEQADELKNEHYDCVINLQPSLKIKGLIFLSGIKKRVNYKKSFKVHAVTNFWQTGLKIFPDLMQEDKIKLYLPEKELEKAQKRMKNLKRPFIIINAGGVLSKRQGRTYPVSKWLELGNKIQQKYNGTIILNGAEEDKKILSPLNEIKNSVNFIGLILYTSQSPRYRHLYRM
ncbi:MAG: glycosyltransferase family 9 protein, partial [Candidatus Gastranaerophilales bacterium]|nr:glycosyltransferase family 9 protein [Candidatus Gastranaerophilales bacterium]